MLVLDWFAGLCRMMALSAYAKIDTPRFLKIVYVAQWSVARQLNRHGLKVPIFRVTLESLA
jgi:hypothetical protein